MAVMVAPGREAQEMIAAVAGKMTVLEAVDAELASRGEWAPLPHQVPPDWDADWNIWLLLGGRGTGKTFAAAHYVNDHAMGPPCDPHLPGGHNIGIVAPTLSDAAYACVTGPTGVQRVNPAIRLVGRKDGTYVVWPNGAQAMLFSTKDKEQCDRLRAHGNRCLAKGTLVRTEHGEVPIEQVRVGDLVWTRSGLRTVTHFWNNGVKAYWKIETNRGSVLCTADHKFWTDRGWIQARFLRPADKIHSWRSSGGTGVGTRATRTGITRAGSGLRRGGHFTGTCGKQRTVRFQMGARSTICSTATGIRLTLRGWSVLRSKSIDASTSFTSAADARPGETGRIATTSVSSVARRFRHGAGLASARRPVVSSSTTALRPAVPTSMSSALSVVRRSGCAPSPHPARARATVRRCSPTGVDGPVYDLTVACQHEFYANDLLTSNCFDWWEEFAAWPQIKEGHDQATLGLRLGKARVVADTTPRPKKKLIEVQNDPKTIVSHGTTYDNPHLPQERRATYERLYKGTDLERQELMGNIMSQATGALWTRDCIERNRVDTVVDLDRVVVAIDPSGGDEPENDEQGIVVAGSGPSPNAPSPVYQHGNIAPQQLANQNGRSDGVTPTDLLKHGYILADRSCRLSPDGWAERGVRAYLEFGADAIVAETNFGGQMVKFTIETVAAKLGTWVNVIIVTASRGKRARAEPVAALYKQDRIHHVRPDTDEEAEGFEKLEDEYCTWVPGSGMRSPNHLDAGVWAITELLISPVGGKVGVM